MYNAKPNWIIETRDVQWLNKSYFFHDIIRSDLPEIWHIQNQKIIAEILWSNNGCQKFRNEDAVKGIQ